MKIRYGRLGLIVLAATALGSCKTGDGSEHDTAKRVEMKLYSGKGKNDVRLSYHRDEGYRLVYVDQKGARHQLGTLRQAQSTGTEAGGGSPLDGLGEMGGGGGGTFSASSTEGGSFSSDTGAGSGFSSSTGASGGFSVSTGAATGFTVTTIGAACDLGGICEELVGGLCQAFAPLAALDGEEAPDCDAAVDECEVGFEAAEIPAAIAPLVCAIIDFTICLIENVDFSALAAGGEVDLEASPAVAACASSLEQVGVELGVLIDSAE